MKRRAFSNFFSFLKGKSARLPEKDKTDGNKKRPKSEKFERCAICGQLTDVPVSTPVDLRENYEVGFGQLCAKCAANQNGVEGDKKAITDAQIMLILEQSRKEDK